MPKKVTFAALFFILVSTTPVFSADVSIENPIDKLSLKDVIRIALINNKDIQIQEREIDYARANIWDARSIFFPKFNLDASYLYSGDYPAYGPSLAGSKKDAGVFSGYQNDNRLGGSVTQVVFNGGGNIANFNQAKLGLRTQEETLRAKKLSVEFDAKRLYYGLLLGYETLRIARNLFEQAQAHYENTRQMYDQGTASKFDVLQSKVQVSKVMPEVVKAANAIEVIKEELKKILSFNMQDPVEIKGELKCSYTDIKEDDFRKEAYKNNPAMILKLIGIDIEKWSIELAKAGYGPQINANFDYNYRSNNIQTMFNYKHTNWDVGFSASVPVFDGFSTKAKVDEAKAKYKQAILQKENVSDQIAVDIKRACTDMMTARAIIDYEKDNIDEAKESLRLANVRFDNGVGTNLDVLDAQVSLSQVEKDLYGGIYDYLMAKASLDMTMGVFYKEE
jgi:outer membrane protein TolC